MSGWFFCAGLLYVLAFLLPRYLIGWSWVGIIVLIRGFLSYRPASGDMWWWVFASQVLPAVPFIHGLLHNIADDTILVVGGVLFWAITVLLLSRWFFQLIINILDWWSLDRFFLLKMLVVVMGLAGYFHGMAHCLFLPFLRIEGLLLWHPIMVLGTMPRLGAFLLIRCGLFMTTFIVVFLCALVAGGLVRTTQSVVVVLVIVMLTGLLLRPFDWVYGGVVDTVSTISARIVIDDQAGCDRSIPWLHRLFDYRVHGGSATLVCTTEGAIQGVLLDDLIQQYGNEIWQNRSVFYLVGGYGGEHQLAVPMIALVGHGHLLGRFVKRVRLPFLEIPLLKGTGCAQSADRPLWDIPGFGLLAPYVCSDFFWGVPPVPVAEATSVLVMAYDGWVSYGPSRYLFWLMTALGAVWWQRPIYFIGAGSASTLFLPSGIYYQISVV